jgi:hypothetical protein
MSRCGLDLIRRPPHDPGMDRRRFLVTSLAGALAVPLAIEAQQTGKVYRLAIVYPAGSAEQMTEPILLPELRRLGYVEGQNFWWSGGQVVDAVNAIRMSPEKSLRSSLT